MEQQCPEGAPHPIRPPMTQRPLGREVWRWSYDTTEREDIIQVGLTVLLDGERRVEVWEPCGPFDPVSHAEDACRLRALSLYCSQLELFG